MQRLTKDKFLAKLAEDGIVPGGKKRGCPYREGHWCAIPFGESCPWCEDFGEGYMCTLAMMEDTE